MPPLTVLVADDNEDFRKNLVKFLKGQEGIGIVRQAKNGLEATAVAGTLRPDLILMDISMPGMNGIEAVKSIKNLSPESKIVFVTIHEEKLYQAFAHLLNVEGFVNKGTLASELPAILRRISNP